VTDRSDPIRPIDRSLFFLFKNTNEDHIDNIQSIKEVFHNTQQHNGQNQRKKKKITGRKKGKVLYDLHNSSVTHMLKGKFGGYFE